MGHLRILSNDRPPFENREEAGRLLGEALAEYHGLKIVVVGIPRGGLVTARTAARVMAADLDIVFAHKLGAPGQPECAMGAVGESGNEVVDQSLFFPVSREYLESEKKNQLAQIEERIQKYRSVLPKISLEKKTVVIADDGIAMGYTVQAALETVRTQKPGKVILALPVGPKETIERLARRADETVCLNIPSWFEGVSQFYRDFSEVTDTEVLKILEEEKLRRALSKAKNSQTA